MAYTVNASLQLSATTTGNVMTDFQTLVLSSVELIKSSVIVAGGVEVGAGVSVDLTNLSAPVLLVIKTTNPVTMRINEEIFDHTIKSLFVFDGTEITSVKFGNSGVEDAVVTVIAYG